MSERDIRRVVIACDVQDEIDAAVRAAAALAARWGVPLHGIFLQNENLRRLAELPFGRPVSPSLPRSPRALESEQLETLFAAIGGAMRRALAVAAEREGVDWSFAELRGVPSGTRSVVAEGDMLVVEARRGAGTWQPRSHWEGVARELGHMVLLRRDGPVKSRRVVLVIDGNAVDHARAFAVARALAQPRDETFLLALAMPAGGGGSALEPTADSSGLPAAAVERVDGAVGLNRRIAALGPRLVVVETQALSGDALQALIAATRCDLLLLG